MAVGGFKCFKLSLGAGRTDSLQERSAFIALSIANGLVSLDQGWSLSAATPVSKPVGTDNSSAIILEHTSGAQLLIAYLMKHSATISRAETMCLRTYDTGSGEYPIGLGMSYSASGAYTISTEGTIDFPANCTPFLGSGAYSYTGNWASFAGDNSLNYAYSLIVRDTVIFWAHRCSTWAATHIGLSVVGTLISETAHEGDAWTKCAAIRFHYTGAGENNLPGNPINSENGDLWPETLTLARATSLSTLYIPRNTSTRPRCSGGNSIEGAVAGTTGKILTAEMQNTQTIGRLAPVWCGIASIEPNTYGVVPGDGFKGYFDSEAIATTTNNVYLKGQTFDGGNRLYVGNGLVIGWDTTNNQNIFTT